MAVKIYSFSDNQQLSKHFKVSEFRCKCGGNHDIRLNSELIDMLEKLIKIVGAEKCIISSGYRCPAHDKRVGGSGNGQHTKGTAVDCCFLDRSGKPISTKLISCKAQDMGFGGIANITAGYDYIHLDVRKGSRYLGNEIKGYNTVTSDFYSYYGIKREILNKGCNDTVKKWQESALKDGFSLPSGSDGIWGAECENVVKKAICKQVTGNFKYKNLTKIVQSAVGATADGLFGENTEKAVKNYQSKNGLIADGIVGEKTWKKILKIT